MIIPTKIEQKIPNIFIGNKYLTAKTNTVIITLAIKYFHDPSKKSDSIKYFFLILFTTIPFCFISESINGWIKKNIWINKL